MSVERTTLASEFISAGLKIRKAARRASKARIALIGPSGSGKTLSGLLIAYGLVGDWERIGVIDTERGSADLYAGVEKAGVRIGEFLKIDLEPPYSPAKYIEAIKTFENAGVEAIVIDSLSHAWAGEGGLLDMQSAAAISEKNSFTAWRHVTPWHNKLVDAMLASPAHIIAAMRAKAEYVIDRDEKGRVLPKKVGLAPVQRDGLEYEFTIVFDLSIEHVAGVSKDRTGLFDGEYFTPTVETGRRIKAWLESAAPMEKKPAAAAATNPVPAAPATESPASSGARKIRVLEKEKKASPSGVPYAEVKAVDLVTGESISLVTRDPVVLKTLEGIGAEAEIAVQVEEKNSYLVITAIEAVSAPSTAGS